LGIGLTSLEKEKKGGGSGLRGQGEEFAGGSQPNSREEIFRPLQTASPEELVPAGKEEMRGEEEKFGEGTGTPLRGKRVSKFGVGPGKK